MSKAAYLPAEERRDLTIRTVLDLCGRTEPSRVTMAGIAGAMGVTQGALFRHFRGRDDIWQAVVEWVGRRLMRRLDRAIGEAGDPPGALRAMFISHIELVTEHPGVPGVILGELQRPDPTPARRVLNGVLASYRARLVDVLDEGRARGDFSPDLDIDAAAVQFIGAIQGLVIQSLIANDVGRAREQAPAVLKLYMRGLGAEAGGATWWRG